MKTLRRMSIFYVTLVAVLLSFNAYGQGFRCSSPLTAEWLSARYKIDLPIPGFVTKILQLSGLEAKITVQFRDTLEVSHDCDCPPDQPCRGPATFFASLTVFSVVKPPGYYGQAPVEGETVTIIGASASNRRELGEGEQISAWVRANQVQIAMLEGSVQISVGLEWLLTLTETRVGVTVDASMVCECSPIDRCLNPETNHPPVLRAPAQVPVPSGERASFFVSVEDEDNDVFDIATSEEGQVVYVFRSDGIITGAQIEITSLGEKEVRIMARDRCGNSAAVTVRLAEVHRPQLTVDEVVKEADYFTVRGFVIDEDLKKPGEIAESLTFYLYGMNGTAGGPYGGATVWENLCTIPPCDFGFYFKPDLGRIAQVGWGGALVKVKDYWGLEDAVWVIFRYEGIDRPLEVEIIGGDI
ncbi:MAG: hypothetical protein ACUVQU_06000 [Candidatus Bipolaricaulia bacterium]